MRTSAPWVVLCVVALGACTSSDGMVVAHAGAGAGDGGAGASFAGGAGGTSGAGGTGAGGMQNTGSGGVSGAGSGGMQNTGSGGVSGGGSGGVSGASGAGGEAGTSAPVTSCTDSDAFVEAASPLNFDHATRGSTTGVEGTFEDRCDAQGNLVERFCETMLACSGGSQNAGACAPTEQPTGLVGERMVDCFGQCADGACHVPCPMVGDALDLHVHELGSLLVLIPSEGPFRFVCMRAGCDIDDAAHSSPLTVIAFNEQRNDCLGAAPYAFGPMTLSDGCFYTGCYAEPKP